METAKKFRLILTYIYLVSIFVGLPFFFLNKYFNITQDKFLYFIYATCGYLLLIVVSTLFDADGFNIKSVNFSIKNPMDSAFLGWVLINVISTFTSRYTNFCFLGNNMGRYNGLVNIIVYFIIYVLAKSLKINGLWLARLFLFTSVFVNIWAILQYFGHDLFDMYAKVNEASYLRMLSPIGHKITYASYLVIAVAIAFGLLIKARDNGHFIIDIICASLSTVFGFIGGFISMSDSFLLGVMALIIVAFISGALYKKDIPFIVIYLALSSIGLSIGGYMKYRAARFQTYARPLEGILGDLFKYRSYLAIAGCLLLFIGFSMVLIQITDRKSPNKSTLLFNQLTLNIARAALMGLLTLGIIIFFCSYPFDDTLGNTRGFVWNIAIDEFKSMSFGKKLIGHGPETLYHIFVANYSSRFNERGITFDNVHCEPLQYLLTCGLLGLICYITMWISYFFKCAKKAGNNPALIIYLLPVFAYLAQSCVNIAQSATTPIMFIFFALGAAALESSKSPDNQC